MPSSLGRVLVLVGGFAALGGALEHASAQTPAKTAEVFVPCTFRGRAELPIGTPITDAGGRPIARFSGAEATVTVAGLSTATPSRARIETGSGQGGFRIRGFVEASRLPIATSEVIPVVAGHVWIGAKRGVSVVAATAERLKLEKRVSQPFAQTFTAWTSCSKLMLGSAIPPGWSPSGDERGYVLRQPSLELHDAPRGGVVSVLKKSWEVPGVLFFGDEQRGGWVHVEYRGEVNVDGWVRASDVQALPRGETMDQLAPSTSMRSSARLSVPGSPRIVRAARELSLRASAREDQPAIGVIDAGAEAYVMDIVAGWASVLPRTLDVMPVENGAFWVKRADLGI